MPAPATKRSFRSAALVAMLSFALLLTPPAIAPAATGPGDPGATASKKKGKKKGRCARKKTKRKRRACRRQRQLDQLSGDFSGSATTTIRYFDFCFNQFVGSETYQLQNVRISVRRPLRPTRLSPDLIPAVGNENNPINLVVGQTTVQDSITPGSVFLASAFRYGQTSPGVILESWRLNLNGAALNGVLFEDHREESAAQNLLAAWQKYGCFGGASIVFPNQYAIAEGTTLSGTLTRNAINLQVTGTTIDGSRPFVTNIAANRAG